jgi:hypothetical protein
MKYTIKAHPTDYGGVHFRSRLEAKWAAFFNCMKWKWAYEPLDLQGWTPDFGLWIKQWYILVEVKPYNDVEQFKTHPCMQIDCGNLASTTAGFGLGPTVVCFKKYLGTLQELGYNTEGAWIAAGNLTQWKPKVVKKKKKSWKEMLKEGL